MRQCGRAGAGLFLAVALLAWLVAGHRADAADVAIATRAGAPVAVRTQPIRHFRIGSKRTRFGALVFLGGLTVRSSDPRFSGLSSIHLDSDRQRFLGVADTGFWYSGRLERDDAGRLAGIADFRMAPIRLHGGRIAKRKEESDAESLAVTRDGVMVGFERDHRIALYPRHDPQASAPERRLPIPFPRRELRSNRGLETLAVAPATGPLAGARVAVSEMSINEAGDIYAGVLDGPRKGTFFVHRDPPFAISDGDFLPDGDLLLLERGVTLASAFQTRIVRIPAASIRPGATVRGTVIFTAGPGDQIDNMEGLSLTRGADGAIHLLLVSDDNGSILQRTLFLEFRLAGEMD